MEFYPECYYEVIYEALKDAFIQQEHWNKLALKLFYAIKRDISLKNENYIIIYSPFTCSKSVWTQKKIFWRMLATKVDGSHWLP